MIAVGAGDAKTARKAADDARTHLGAEPLTLLLSAQAAQLAGDGDRARAAFEALSSRPETRILGLHGLFVEARRQGEHEAARHFAEEAALAAPKIGWAGAALFEYQSQAGDWLGALRTLAANASAKLVTKAEAARLRAVLLTAQAMELEPGDPVEARAAALEAHRLQTGLVPAAVVASRLLSRNSDFRRAAKVLEQAWRAEPHPDLAEAYASVRPGDSVRDRLARVRRLASYRTYHPEGAMAVARAAIDAHDWQAARAALEGLVKTDPSERVCLLMAEIEERENGDQGRVRGWLTRAITAPRDPAWIADGHAFDRWMPVSPVSGKVGAFEWKVAAANVPSREVAVIQAELAAAAAAALPAPAPEPVFQAEPPEPDPEDAEVAPLAVDEPVEAPIVRQPPVVEIEAEVIPEKPPEPEPAPPPKPEPEAQPEPKAAAAPPPKATGATPPPEGEAKPEPKPAVSAAPKPEAPSEPAAKEKGEPGPVELTRPPDDPGPDGDDLPEEPPRRRFRLL